MKHLHVITDLQFGSTGKGLFAGYLAKRIRPDLIVAAWGPNAGHTFIDCEGTKHVNIMVPNGIVADSVKKVLIGPGSIINPEIMFEELFGRYGHQQHTFMIHEHAAVVLEEHREAERKYGYSIGSTMKGVGEAVMHKLRRRRDHENVAKIALRNTPLEGYVVTVDEYNEAIDRAETVLLEGAQGFSLSINQGFYPYTTSRDCTTHQLLSDCGLPAARWSGQPMVNDYRMRVYGVARTFPIRVANRYKECGCVSNESIAVRPDPSCPACLGFGKIQIGWSGPGYPDQVEISWESIGREPELTTVTKLPRRIFTFSKRQIHEAVRMNGVDEVFLNFCNYLKTPAEVDAVIAQINESGAVVRWLGYGATESDVMEIPVQEYQHRPIVIANNGVPSNVE